MTGIEAGICEGTGIPDAGEIIGRRAGEWVPQFNILGLGEKEKRGMLYHGLYSSQAPGFRSENDEIEKGIDQVSQQLLGYRGEKTWVMDRGSDNDRVWWKIWRLGDHLEFPEIHFLAILGGWEARPDRKPGKIILSRGLRRLLDKFATDALLSHYRAVHGDLPPFFKQIEALSGSKLS